MLIALSFLAHSYRSSSTLSSMRIMKPFFHRTNRDNRFGPLVAQFEYERPPLGNQQRPAAGRRENCGDVATTTSGLRSNSPITNPISMKLR